MTIYFVKNKQSGKFLSHIFEDTPDKIFQVKEINVYKCYWYKNQKTAQFVADNFSKNNHIECEVVSFDGDIRSIGGLNAKMD